MPNIPATIKASEVSDLEFREIVDPISHKWATWWVGFTYNGKPCSGDLGACPHHPELMHDIEIVECDSEIED